MRIILWAALSALCLFSNADSFSIPQGQSKPSAFVTDTLVPWYDRAQRVFSVPKERSPEQLSDHSDWQKAALAYEKILGIPPRFFQHWLSGQMGYDDDTHMLVPWAAVVSTEDVSIEGGAFDPTSIYDQMMQDEIRRIKEKLLKLFDESDVLELPLHLQLIPRPDLLDSNFHDEDFQKTLIRMVESREENSELTWHDGDWYSLKVFLSGYSLDWYRSLSNIRQAAYFSDFDCKGIQRALDRIFESTDYYQAGQKHLVKHLDAWKANPKLIPQLHKDVLVGLLLRGNSNEFLTKDAMSLAPKDLLCREREEILDMPFDGLESLQDTEQVRVLRTEREIIATGVALNHTSFLDPSSFYTSPWGLYRSVAVALCDSRGTVTALGEFMFKDFIGGRRPVLLGGGSSVSIFPRNCQLIPEHAKLDDGLIEVCSNYHRDFLYRWRLEHLGAEKPESVDG